MQIDKSWTLWIEIVVNNGKNNGNDAIFNQIKRSIKEELNWKATAF